jgi:excisionase family DNA binding protein
MVRRQGGTDGLCSSGDLRVCPFLRPGGWWHVQDSHQSSVGHRGLLWCRSRRCDINRQEDTKLLYRPEEAARLLGIGRSTVYALMDAGDIERIKIGRSTRIPRGALQAFIRARAARAVPCHRASPHE